MNAMKKFVKITTVSTMLLPLGVCAQNNPLLPPVSAESIVIETPPPTPLTPEEQLNSNIASMFNDPVMRNAQWGFVVYDPKKKKIINSYNENASLIPASTTKLLTTEAAMSLFGKDYQWVTQLEHSGSIDEQGILNGNLYIVGSGDPSLGTGRAGASTYGALVSDFVRSVKDLGIKRVKGDIVLKTAVFKSNKTVVLPANIVWKGSSRGYFVPMGSTNDTDPRQERLLGRKNPEDQKFVYLSPFTQEMVYTENFGGIALSTKLPDTPAYLGNNLKASLAKNGIITEGKVVNQSEPEQNLSEERKKIMAYQSPKLEDMVYFINQTSNNHMSEALLKTTGFYKYGDFSLDTGRTMMNKHLSKKMFDFQGFN